VRRCSADWVRVETLTPAEAMRFVPQTRIDGLLGATYGPDDGHCDAHGIAHSPATGMLIAEEILDGRAHTIDIDELRITRFLEGKPSYEQNIVC
jgi:glycine/D-amino acid oxidase-like deaminating enzyme